MRIRNINLETAGPIVYGKLMIPIIFVSLILYSAQPRSDLYYEVFTTVNGQPSSNRCR